MTNQQTMKDRLVQQVENEINQANRKRDNLYAQIEEIEAKIAQVEQETAEARGMLHFLKTGKERPVQAVPTIAKPRVKNTRAVAVSDATYRETAVAFGSREFTTKEFAEKSGASHAAAQQKASKLTEEGFLIRTREAQTVHGEGGGRKPALYRVNRSRIEKGA